MRRVSVPSSRVAIMGAGVSALLLDLLADGYESLDAVDVSAAAHKQLGERLGPDVHSVRFVCADVLDLHLDGPVDVWHDRAVFHFLTDASDQVTYVQRANEAVAPGGHLVMATFAPGGPEQCSGLPVVKWSADDLAELFGEKFDLVDSCTRDHLTPWGAAQAFTHALLVRRAD